jgi:hypothetical protein
MYYLHGRMIVALNVLNIFNKVIYFISIISMTNLDNIIMRMITRGETTLVAPKEQAEM